MKTFVPSTVKVTTAKNPSRNDMVSLPSLHQLRLGLQHNEKPPTENQIVEFFGFEK